MHDPNYAPLHPVISVQNLSKTYASGLHALKRINLEIRRGEIFGLLGPNGAGKTTLIGIICGIVNPSAGTVSVDGHDIIKDYRAARALIGLVPQELTTDAFETVWATVSFSRGLFGKPKNPAHIEKVLRDLSLWNRKDFKDHDAVGRHETPSADRQGALARTKNAFPRRADGGCRCRTAQGHVGRHARPARGWGDHHPDNALPRRGEEMADRIGVINKGEIILVEDKATLICKLGKKQLTLELHKRLDAVPAELASHHLALAADGAELIYTYDTQAERTGITALLKDLNLAGIRFKDLHTTQSSLEDIFVDLVGRRQ